MFIYYFFKFKFIYFNWRLITLQYCIGFAVHQHESAKGVHVCLKLNIQKIKIMASSPITSWERDGKTVETVPDFIFGGPKITVDGDCSHEIKRRLLLGRKVMTNIDSILRKQRHYFVNNGSSSQGYRFSCGHVWM